MLLEHNWRGVTNSRYEFQVHSNDSAWPYWGGVYMLCSRSELGWVVHYIGETDDLSEALTPGNDSELHSSALYATHVHFMLCCDPLERKRASRDLTAALQPAFNLPVNILEPLSKVA